MRKRWLFGVMLALILLASLLVLALWARSNKKPHTTVQAPTSFSLDILSGKHFAVNRPTSLRFAVRDQQGKLFKDFDTDDDYRVQLIVIRKDRTNFQHLHPSFNEAKGTFTMDNFQFSTDGSYRIFAVFSLKDTVRNASGESTTLTPFQDVSVGNSTAAAAQSDTEKLEDTVNGFTTRLVFLSDDSPEPQSTSFFTGVSNPITVSIDKDGAPYTSLEGYKGSLGRLAAIGPNLELVAVNAESIDIAHQTGLIPFTVSFPSSGAYKLFLQTKADGTFTTTEFTVSVKPVPAQSKNIKS